jgi:GNAT superfamily N-acetyltransferase
LRPYAESDWLTLRSFIQSQWGVGHPMAERRLFDWQFRGFGRERETVRSLLLFIDGELAGFRGIIPGLYQVPSQKGMQVLPGGSLAMWMLREEFRGKGLGRIMHEEAERLCPVVTGAGSNPETSVRIYLQKGFQLLESMNRYLAVLDPEACAARFGEPSAQIPSRARWGGREPLGPIGIDAAFLAEIWERSAFEAGFFSLYRNAEFWRWRILESPAFHYLVFVDPEGSGFLVARVEPLLSTGGAGFPPSCVLRLIDLVPEKASAWHGFEDAPFARFLERCLDWARETGCIAVDFHCTSGVFGPILSKAGFAREQDLLEGEIPPLPRFFNGGPGPGRPINALAKAPGVMSFERVYMVKSDNDMDRPRRLDENGQILY